MIRLSYLIWLSLLVAACQSVPTASQDVEPEPKIESEQKVEVVMTADPDDEAAPAASAATGVRERKDDILPPVDPLEVRGDLRLAGSNAIAPLIDQMAERFVDEGFAGNLVVERVGSGVGFNVFCAERKSDIATASRPITEEERQACLRNGRQPVPLLVGNDAVAIVVNETNNFAKDITRAELSQIFTADRWSDVRPSWPDELIRRTVPEPGSGALRLFVTEVMEDNPKPLFQAPNTDFFSEDEDYLVQAVSTDPYAVAFLATLTTKITQIRLA